MYGGTPPLEAYPANQRATIREQQRAMPLRGASLTGERKTRA